MLVVTALSMGALNLLFWFTLRYASLEGRQAPSRLATVVRERGGPAHLLLPRGRREGMLFRFQVTVTGEEQESEKQIAGRLARAPDYLAD